MSEMKHEAEERAALLALFDAEQRVAVEFPGLRREVLPDLVRHVDAAGGDGLISYSRLDENNAEAAIRAQVEYFTGLGQGLEWKLYSHDRPADLRQRLEAHGFQVGEAEALLVLDLAQAPDALWQPPAADIRRIDSAEQLADVLSVRGQVWAEDDPSGLAAYLTAALREGPERMSIHVAYADGRPASSAWILYPDQGSFASLWGGSTVPEFRGRGLYTALLAVRAQEARRRGLRYLTVDASPMSRPILEKHGFFLLAWTWPCEWKPGTSEGPG